MQQNDFEIWFKNIKQNNNEYNEFLINENMKISVQKYTDSDLYLELQLKDNICEFGEYIININYYIDKVAELISLIKEYEKEIKNKDINSFIKKHINEFI